MNEILSNAPPLFIDLVIFVFGLLWGSFFNVCIVRLPEEKSVIGGRSFCPKCQSLIPWFCNIPIISYLMLRGRCRNCKIPISIQYPLIELFSGLMFLGLYFYYGASKEYLFALVFCSALLIVSVIDLNLVEIGRRSKSMRSKPNPKVFFSAGSIIGTVIFYNQFLTCIPLMVW